MKTITKEDFESRLSVFLGKLKNSLDEYKVKQGLTYFDNYGVSIERGKKYIRVYRDEVKDGSPRSSHIVAFIDATNGDILKPATYKAPAKHARGNLMSEKYGMEAIAFGGFVRYL